MTEHFIITVLVIYGIHASTRPNMILAPIGNFISNKLTDLIGINTAIRISKVLFDCTPCMASLYGTVSFFLVRPYPSPLLLSWAVWVFSLCGFNYILNKIINK